MFDGEIATARLGLPEVFSAAGLKVEILVVGPDRRYWRKALATCKPLI
jgi:hypothetical protein